MEQHILIEQGRIIDKMYAAIDADDWDTATKYGQQLIVAPELARCFKKVFGADDLKNSGLNLSAAEERYGKDWLDK